MRLGVSVPTARPDGSPLTGEALVGSARHIEQAGFDSAWFFDAIGRGFMLPDPLIGGLGRGRGDRRASRSAPACCRSRCATRWSWRTASSPRT